MTQAEVRGFQHDGLHLQARSRKYGKVCGLENSHKSYYFVFYLLLFSPQNVVADCIK